MIKKPVNIGRRQALAPRLRPAARPGWYKRLLQTMPQVGKAIKFKPRRR